MTWLSDSRTLLLGTGYFTVFVMTENGKFLNHNKQKTYRNYLYCFEILWWLLWRTSLKISTGIVIKFQKLLWSSCLSWTNSLLYNPTCFLRDNHGCCHIRLYWHLRCLLIPCKYWCMLRWIWSTCCRAMARRYYLLILSRQSITASAKLNTAQHLIPFYTCTCIGYANSLTYAWYFW